MTKLQIYREIEFLKTQARRAEGRFGDKPYPKRECAIRAEISRLNRLSWTAK